MRSTRSILLAATLAVTASAVAWQQATHQLQIEGKTISTNLKVVDGELMVNARDIASFLGGDLQVQNGTATIVAKKAGDQAGGAPNTANPIEAGSPTGAAQPMVSITSTPQPIERTSKVGESIDNDGYRFSVVGVQEVKGSYRTKFDPRKRRVTPRLNDERLVVINIRLENGTGLTNRPTVPSGFGSTLFDDKGTGFPVAAFDARPLGDPNLVADLAPYTFLDVPTLAPQGTFEYAVLFSVPKDRQVKEVVFAVPPTTSDKGGTNVTVDVN